MTFFRRTIMAVMAVVGGLMLTTACSDANEYEDANTDNPSWVNGYNDTLKIAHPQSLAGTRWIRATGVKKDVYGNEVQGFVESLNFVSADSVAVKQRIVTEDPTEQGIRKALNLGHTAGHAFESLALGRGEPVLHGYAVAWGLVCELYLSARMAGFPKQQLTQTVQFIREHYGTFRFDCKQYDRLYELMTHDKKNAGGIINFTLLAGIGDILINQHATKEAVMDMLDFFRECM